MGSEMCIRDSRNALAVGLAMIRLIDPQESVRRLAIALIPETAEGTGKWLCVWQRDRKCFDFVSATHEREDSPRESLLAEVCASLSLAKRDILVSSMAQLNLEFELSVPSQSAPTRVAVAFYHVFMYRQAAMETLAQLTDIRWLIASELLGGETSDGYAVSHELHQMLVKSDVIPSW